MREILFRGKRLEVVQFATEKVCEKSVNVYMADMQKTALVNTFTAPCTAVEWSKLSLILSANTPA